MLRKYVVLNDVAKTKNHAIFIFILFLFHKKTFTFDVKPHLLH